jgi:hypothetical protein
MDKKKIPTGIKPSSIKEFARALGISIATSDGSTPRRKALRHDDNPVVAEEKASQRGDCCDPEQIPKAKLLCLGFSR